MLVIINFDGVGIFEIIILIIEYLEGWNDIILLVLLGDNFVMSMDVI